MMTELQNLYRELHLTHTQLAAFKSFKDPTKDQWHTTRALDDEAYYLEGMIRDVKDVQELSALRIENKSLKRELKRLEHKAWVHAS